jgi:hypothetical protein
LARRLPCCLHGAVMRWSISTPTLSSAKPG